jgi:hypothetical protein
MKTRLAYFEKHLGIEFAKNKDRLIAISTIRNKLAHRHPLEPITKADTSIPLPELQKTVASVIRASMKTAFDCGKSKYSRYFLEGVKR